MLNKKGIKDVEVKGKKVLVRVDFNVPLNENGVVIDDTRIVASVPTIKYLMDKGAKVILLSHLGRPKGEPNKKYSLKPVIQVLSNHLQQEVTFAPDDVVVGENAKQAIEAMQNGDVVLLENVRFREEETQNGEDFAKELASLGDVFINDAFGTSHRAHASNTGIASILPAYAGMLLERELDIIGVALDLSLIHI